MSSTCIINSPTTHFNKTGIFPASMASEFDMGHPALRGEAETSSYNPGSNEVMRGTVTLLSPTHGPQRVILSVTRTSVDHFALVYPDNRRKITAIKPVGCINLRGVTCEETLLSNGITGFTLRPKKCDTSSAALIFVCQDISALSNWLDALSPSSATPLSKHNIPRQCSLPSLEEEEE